MKLKNFTPHAITLINENGQVEVIESQGLARVGQFYAETGLNYNGILIKTTGFLDVGGLPEPEEDTYLIVSQIVAQAAKGKRSDLIFPGDFVRDESGKILGCKSLLCF